MKHMIFDLETVPDYRGLRRLIHADSEMLDSEVLLKFWQQRKPNDDEEAHKNAFLPVHLHRVVTVGVALADFEEGHFRLWSIAEEDGSGAQEDERKILERFFEGINRHTPQLVSWNGSGFDLPVLQHRAMIHGVISPTYWDIGDHRGDFRYNNYLNRYQYRHLDMMDVLAGYNGRNFAKLDDMALLCGLPGKQGIGGAEVAGAFAKGRIGEIRRYCEADVINTYGLYLRFLLISGRLSAEGYAKANEACDMWLNKQTDAFWVEFRGKA